MANVLKAEQPALLPNEKVFPSGEALADSWTSFVREKCDIVSSLTKSDAQLIMDYLPAMVEGVRQDPKYKNRRNCFLTNHSSKHDHPLLSLINRRCFPILFTEDAHQNDLVNLLEGQLANTVILQYPDEEGFFYYPTVELNHDGWVDEPSEK